MIKFDTTEIYLNKEVVTNVESFDIQFHKSSMLPKIAIKTKLSESELSFNVYWLLDIKLSGKKLELEIANIDENVL